MLSCCPPPPHAEDADRGKIEGGDEGGIKTKHLPRKSKYCAVNIRVSVSQYEADYNVYSIFFSCLPAAYIAAAAPASASGALFALTKNQGVPYYEDPTCLQRSEGPHWKTESVLNELQAIKMRN